MDNINWNNYRSQFPKRYWEEGEFDVKLESFLNAKTDLSSCLDVGAGVLGTRVLKDYCVDRKIPVDLLDPYVSLKPEHFRAHVRWDDNDLEAHYSLICARGSINYLSVPELAKLGSMLAVGGTLVANTFLDAPSSTLSRRKCVNEKGQEGIEESQLVDGVVYHKIIFEEYEVSHTFFYHSLETYRNVFKDIKVERYGKNSAMLIVNKY